MNRRYTYYVHFAILVLYLLASPTDIFAQKRAELLGGGRTNFSDKKKDTNGLLTGMHSEVLHLFGIYTEGAYSSVLFTNPNMSTMPSGYAYGGGICYEFQYYSFKTQIGVGLQVQDHVAKVYDVTMYDHNVSDAWGYPYHLKYDFRERVDTCRNLHLQIPILFGYGGKNIYGMAGVKLNINAYRDIGIKAIGSTTATYDQFFGTFEEMDNHGLRKDVPIQFASQTIFAKPMSVLASIEVGGEWGTKYHPIVSRMRLKTSEELQKPLQWRIRVAAFCDFGITTARMRPSANELVTIPQNSKWDFCTYKMNHVLSVKQPFCSDFYVGIKVTAFIGFLRYVQCVLCKDQSEADMENPFRKDLPKSKIHKREP